MNEHLNARISANQLAVTLIVSRLPLLLFLPMLTGVYAAREYLLASGLSFLLCLPFVLAARRGGGRVSALFSAGAAAYLLFCGAAGVAWPYSYLLSVSDNPLPSIVFGAILLGTAVYAVYCGPEAVARISLIVLVLFLAGCAFCGVRAAGQLSAANLGGVQAALPSGINLAMVVNAFAHPEIPLFLLLRDNVVDREKLGGAAGRYCVWTFAIQGGFFFLLELAYGNAPLAREYPAVLLFGGALCTALFIAASAVRLYAFTVGATIALKPRFGRRGAAAAVFSALAFLCALLMHERRAVSVVLSLMILLGGILYLFTILFLTVGAKDETVQKNGGDPADADPL